MKNICIYHSADLDGICSAAIVNHFVPDCRFIGMNYNEDLYDKISKKELSGNIVYMVDFSLEPFDSMVELNDNCKFIWIDHHKSAIDEYYNYNTKFPRDYFSGSRSNEFAACELCWKYFTDEPMPYFIELIGRHDVWDLEGNPDIQLFQQGMKAIQNLDPTHYIWDDFFNEEFMGRNTLHNIIDDGKVISEYTKESSRKKCLSSAFETTFEGFRAICCNATGGSKLFDSVYDPDRHDLMIVFSLANNRKWMVSLYSTKETVDCSIITKKYGGGGHRSAAGMCFTNEQMLGLIGA